MEKKLTYRDAGVDIDAGNESVRLIKDSVRATYRPEVLGDLGGGHLLAVDEPVENLQGVDLPDALGTHPHPACQSVLRPWLLAPR